MVVYLVPAARNRHELYFEAPDDSPHHPEPPPGLFRRWALTAAGRWHDLVELAREDVVDSRLARWRNTAIRAVVESIAEQRALWALTGQPSACARFPSSLGEAAARQSVMALLGRARRHHLRWLIIDLMLLTVSGILAIVPGPNLIAYYFMFRVVGHLQSWRGARQGTKIVVWTFEPDAGLSELGSLVDVPREARARRVAAIAERLNLPHLSVFFDRVAVPSA